MANIDFSKIDFSKIDLTEIVRLLSFHQLMENAHGKSGPDAKTLNGNGLNQRSSYPWVSGAKKDYIDAAIDAVDSADWTGRGDFGSFTLPDRRDSYTNNLVDPGHSHSCVGSGVASGMCSVVPAPMAPPPQYVPLHSFPFYPNPCPVLPRETPKLEHAFVAGEIIAWRCWRLPRFSNTLESMYNNTVWPPDTGMIVGDPEWSSQGVYCWKDRARCLEYSKECAKHMAGHEIFYGEVKIWGDVVEHDEGYRAQYAKIKSLSLVRGWNDAALEMVRFEYGVGAPCG